jgi:hypothetical protein
MTDLSQGFGLMVAQVMVQGLVKDTDGDPGIMDGLSVGHSASRRA